MLPLSRWPAHQSYGEETAALIYFMRFGCRLALQFPVRGCYPSTMLKRRIKRRELEGACAVQMMSDLRASIAALNDEDLLDLADIFRADAKASLMKWAAAEMERRNLSL